jgi:large subunit ribosomal protein L46
MPGDDAADTAAAPKVRRILKPREKRPIIQKQRKVNADHEKRAKEMGLGFRIIGATVLHRYPTITPDPEPWEVEMHGVQEKILAKSREWFMSQVGGTASQMIPDNNPSLEEILESMPFKPASRVTEADEKDDRRSLDRKLPRSLFLVVKRNRKDNPWQFPQGKLLDAEGNLRAAAERVIDRAVGKTRRWFISNAPIGHYCYAYPKEIQEQRKQYGAQVFFYRCQLIEGNVKLETKLYKDYAWISRDEVGEYFDKDTADFMTALLPE